jgi:hypothetical protein
MIQYKTLRYYEWEDVEKFLCDEIGINQNKFRDYHTVIGGKYKDLWHVWLSITYDSIRNDSYEPAFFDMLLEALKDEVIIKEYGDWISVLKAPIEKLQATVGDDHIMIHYCW